MLYHKNISNADVLKKIKAGKICFGGNRVKKIFGTLHCKAGKRMNVENRVFFASAAGAVHYGYRPCSICMNAEYKNWKNGLV